MELADKKWKLFKLDDLFIKKTIKGYPKKEEDLTECPEGYHVFGQNIRYQYPQKIKLKDIYLHKIEPKFPILAYTSSVGEIGMIEESFYRSGDNGAFQGLFPKMHKFNRFELLFIYTVIQNKFKEYDYTTSMANVMNMEIPLPVNDIKKPDWEWMEQFIKLHQLGINAQIKEIINIADGDKSIIKTFAEKIEIDDFKTWLQDNINFDTNIQMSHKSNKQFGAENTSLLKLSDRKWNEFKLTDIFYCVIGNGIDASKVKISNDSNVNYVSRTSINNGIVARVDTIEECEPFEEGKLTLSLGGEYLGSCFIQPDKFYTAQNVAVLSCKDEISQKAKQFIATMIRNEAKIKFFAFGRELNSHYKTDFKIMLPVNSDEKPDYQFMENYISQIEKSLIK